MADATPTVKLFAGNVKEHPDKRVMQPTVTHMQLDIASHAAIDKEVQLFLDAFEAGRASDVLDRLYVDTPEGNSKEKLVFCTLVWRKLLGENPRAFVMSLVNLKPHSEGCKEGCQHSRLMIIISEAMARCGWGNHLPSLYSMLARFIHFAW